MYVTLEPCNHWGRTPPCVEAIIAHGIQRVVYAYADPNPVVAANQTPQILREHGIDVLHYPLAEIDRFYQSYHHWSQTHKPWVTVKMAHTLDGHITAADGGRMHISNAACAEFTHQQRKASDVILTTARTIIEDNPQLTVRLPDMAVTSKPLAVLDTRLSLPFDMQALRLSQKTHVYHSEEAAVTQSHADCVYHAMPMQKTQLDLAAVIGHLGSLGYHDVWVEAGRQLFTALHQAGLVQRTHIYIAPKLRGGQGAGLYAQLQSFEKAKTSSWQVMDDNAILTVDW